MGFLWESNPELSALSMEAANCETSKVRKSKLAFNGQVWDSSTTEGWRDKNRGSKRREFMSCI